MYCCAKPNLDETRTVLIIGGGNGIGYCLTQTLLEKTTDNVISCDIDIKSSLQNLHHQTQQKDASNRFHISSIDVTDPVSVQKCIDYIKTIKVARIDRVVLSCGVFKGAPLLEISDEDFISVMNVNVIGIWRVIKLLYANDLLKYTTSELEEGDRNDNSRIIILSSEMAFCHIVPFAEPYALSKSCLQDLCRTLKIELSTINIDVITINPGSVDTKLLKAAVGRYKGLDKTSPFVEPYELTLKTKQDLLANFKVSECQYIVDNALLYAVHCDHKYIKYEYHVRYTTWINHIQQCIPNWVYDRFWITVFWLKSTRYCKGKNKKL
eukprot:225324_1